MMSSENAFRPTVETCPVCAGRDFVKIPYLPRLNLVACRQCGLELRSPQASNEELAIIYGEDYYVGTTDGCDLGLREEMKRGSSRRYLRQMAKQAGSGGKTLLEFGCGHGDFLVEAVKMGFAVTGVEYSPHGCQMAEEKLQGKGNIICGDISTLKGSEVKYDYVVMVDLIEHVRNPREFMGEVRHLVKKGGVIFIVTPNLEALSAKLLRKRWAHYKEEHLYYFGDSTIKQLLRETGFSRIAVGLGWKSLNFEYIHDHFVRYPVGGITPLMSLVAKLLPTFLQRHLFFVKSGMEIVAVAD